MNIESLEFRRLLAVTAHVSARGTLLVTGTSGGDDITVSSTPSMINVAANGATQMFDAPLVRRLSIDDGEGLLRVLQALTPPPAFQGLTELLAQVLTPTHWAALQQRIPNLELAPIA